MGLNLFSLVCLSVTNVYSWVGIPWLPSLLVFPQDRQVHEDPVQRKKNKMGEQIIPRKSEKMSIHQWHTQDGTHSLSWWSWGTRLSSGSRRTLKVQNKIKLKPNSFQGVKIHILLFFCQKLLHRVAVNNSAVSLTGWPASPSSPLSPGGPSIP